MRIIWHMADLTWETAVMLQHHVLHIAGLDEAGRGALAGPVVAAAVMLPLDRNDTHEYLAGVNDSKQLTARQREMLFTRITQYAIAYGIGQQAAEIIDAIGIIPATKRAMQQALDQLRPQAEFLLIDGRIRLQNNPLPQQAIIRGDGKSLSIAAASILAKVTRDRLLQELDAQYPAYGFARHKGYGTEYHLAAIAAHGPCPLHRQTFAPMKRPLL
ncbi:MAG: ribonuclease HII [Anaerolineales bacterium]|nr:ribonuclease HII [Anaerolineales bacterium]